MRLKKIILIRFKRFNLSNIQQFTYTPDSQEQVILGSNGSGKSSLLRAIMAMVPNGNDFRKGGGQEHHFEHNGSNFSLISVYNVKAGHHQFIMDGVDLNDGNTQATQKELVARYTGLTAELVDLITGRVKLSSMPASKRREWMMRISGTDFDLALKLFETFRVKARDMDGTVRYLLESTHNLADEIRSMEEDYRDTDAEISELKELTQAVNQALNGRLAVTNSESVVAKMMTAWQTIQQRSQTIVAETMIRSPKFGGRTKAEVELELVRLRDRMMQARGECDTHEKALEGIQSLIKHVGRESLDDPSQLTTRIAGIEEELAGILAQGPLYECGSDTPDGLLAVAQGIQSQLGELCSTIPSNTNNTFTRGDHQARVARYTQLSQWCIETQNVISKLEASLEHATHTQDTDCPKCQHTFKPGWPEQLLRDTEATLAKRRDQIEIARKEMEELSTLIGEFDDYSRKLGDLGRIRESSKALSGFWNMVTERGYVRSNPAMIPVALADVVRQLIDTGHAQRISHDLKDLQGRLELIKNSGDPKFLLQRADMLEGELHAGQEEIREALKQIAITSEEVYHLEMLDKLIEEMDQACADFEQYKAEVEVALKEEHLDTLRDKAITRLGILHGQTQRYRDLVARHENGKSELIDVEAKFASFKLIAKSLSPTHGIVAEVTKGFIHHFVEMMNDHIAMVWSYPMEIRAVLEEGATLTCKFPISINGEDDNEGDVADGSTGQVSMIDFAFKLVVMDMLGLHDYPLLADEFGKDFDDEHRERLVSYIKSLMDQGRFSQLFMVSHYSSVYGSFNGAEFVVLNDQNITRPVDCNRNVEIS